MIVNRSLEREDFPFTLIAYRFDNMQWCWMVTLLAPPQGELNHLYVPPLAREEGTPIVIRTITAQGHDTITGPYDEDQM